MFKEAKSTNITDYQKQIIFGSLLGDMGCYKRKNYVNWALSMNHGKCQEEYFLWKFEQLKPLFNKWRFYTRKSGSIELLTDSVCHPELKYFGEMFYKDKIKIIPKDFDELITPLSLAVWIMDDGTISIKNSSGYKILTCSFSYEDNERAAYILKQKLDLEFKVITICGGDHKKYPALKASVEQSKIISNIIKPYILNSMLYKTF